MRYDVNAAEKRMEKLFGPVVELICQTDLEKATMLNALMAAYFTGITDTFTDPSLGISFKNEKKRTG